MALGSTIYKAELSIADIARGYYADHVLSLARHPSETEERLMTRLLAFALHAHEDLKFGRGISTDDEPDLWQRDPTGAIALWIDVGLPDERSVRKACGRAGRVVVLAYGGRKLDMWWQQNAEALARNRNLEVVAVSADETSQLAALAQRSMRLSCTVQEGSAWIGSDHSGINIEIQHLKRESEERYE
ncbi:MAG: YaeQ family protein [Burkholderiaceae bacterium]